MQTRRQASCRTPSFAEARSVLHELGMHDPGEWTSFWSATGRDYTAGHVFFLQREFVERACDTLGLQRRMRNVFVDAAVALAADRRLERLAWHCRVLLFRLLRTPEFHAWPRPPGEWGAAAHMFYASILLSALPDVESVYAARHIPARVFRDTFADLQRHLAAYRDVSGTWGLETPVWLIRHFTCRLFALGRLQYLFDTFRHSFRAFRNRIDGRVILLAEPGLVLNVDGAFDGVDGAFDPQAWTSFLDLRVFPIRGNPVLPEGRVLRGPCRLPVCDWLQVLAPGDPALSLHIPRAGRLDFARCGRSLRAAARFFASHFPDRPYRAFVCDSWLLDPQFEAYLGPASNIVRFLREFYLHPVPGRNAGVFSSVFGCPHVDPRTAPRDTSLRRAALDHVLGGGRWSGAGGVLFPEDLRWGQAVYRGADWRDVNGMPPRNMLSTEAPFAHTVQPAHERIPQ